MVNNIINSYINSLININKEEVLRYLEYKGQYIDRNLNDLIDECIKMTKEKINPRYYLRVYPILRNNDNKSIFFEDCRLNFKSNDLYTLLHGCEACIILGTTLGINIEKEIRKYSYIDLTKSIVLDACATTSIEELCDIVEKELSEELNKEGKYLTMRYSPGYGDLSIESNKDIIDTLNLNKNLGLTITSNNIMIPRKSVIAIIGITSEDKINKKHKCIMCSNYTNCKYRKGDEDNECKGVYKE
ncbi:hypothetical protein SDC9_79210 [bioreactor metagenome]|uniref:AdoMet activation domain-containing protein n=1 Tax=bioreactor metagenome TaxID=1076179 RepID=A0A644YVN3_9ZZZZ|nr:vitamin B12 dependent-methionine synthase activation domain-containing protein [Romboutsia lituseburensis]